MLRRNKQKKKLGAEINRQQFKGVKAKLIEPNYGRFVTLQVLAEEPVLSMMIDMLTTIKGYHNTSVTTSGNVVTFTFSDDSLAEIFRTTWES